MQLSFVDANGNVLKMTEALVIPGQSQSLDLNHDTEAGANAGVRFEVRAVLRIPPASATTARPASCVVSSLEIFDGVTGRPQALLTETHTLSASIATPLPQPRSEPGVQPNWKRFPLRSDNLMLRRGGAPHLWLTADTLFSFSQPSWSRARRT